jgi:hypothetical protein
MTTINITKTKSVVIKIHYEIIGDKVYCQNGATASYLWGGTTTYTDLKWGRGKLQREDLKDGGTRYFFLIKDLQARLDYLKKKHITIGQAIKNLSEALKDEQHKKD